MRPSTSTSSPSRSTAAARPAGAARSRRMHLLQGGCRQVAARRLRAGGQALGHGRHPRRTSASTPARGLWITFEPVLEQAHARVPVLETARHPDLFNGPESFTPGRPLPAGRGGRSAGPVRRLPASTRSASRVGRRGQGAGRVDRDRRSPMDLLDVDVRRMHAVPGQPRLSARPHRGELGLLYAMHWPFRQWRRARGVRAIGVARPAGGARRLLRRELAAGSAPTGTRRPASTPAYDYSYGRQNWFAARGRRMHAPCARRWRCSINRRSPSSSSKGRDALRACSNRICANDVDVAPGRLVYTQWLNERGGIEADLTVTRLGEDRVHGRHRAPRRRAATSLAAPHIPARGQCCRSTDVTSALPMLGADGARDRARCCAADAAPTLPTRRSRSAPRREIEIGYASVRASRITYVGELGWELYVPAEFALHVFDRVAGGRRRARPRTCGLPRDERLPHREGLPPLGPRHRRDDTPLEAGLGVHRRVRQARWLRRARGGYCGGRSQASPASDCSSSGSRTPMS